MTSQIRDAAIVGIHEYPLRKAPGVSALDIKAASASKALEDAGLGWDDVDAIYDAGDGGGPISGLALCEYLGIHPTIVDTTSVGGSSYEFHASHARRDIARGKAKVALLTYGSIAASGGRGLGGGPLPPDPISNMEDPWGMTLISNYGLACQRHMFEFGTTAEQLAAIAVTTRAHAMRNPAAVQGLNDLRIRDVRDIEIADVLASRMIADPLRLLECCLVSDGGGAVVIASPEAARDTRHKPVWILGSGEAVKFPENGGDITVSAAAQSGPIAFGEAGITPSEIDIAMIYDSFTITVLMMLEDLGFCKKGEGGSYVAGDRLRFDNPGGPALNTDGGGLSSNHPGMRGLFLLIEAVRQLRGDSTSQVPGARLAVAHGNGGYLGTRHAGGTIILGGD